MAAAADVLDRAADLVAQGWCQGRMSKSIRGKQCYCIVGAIDEVTGFDSEAHYRACEIASRSIPGGDDDEAALAAYNDAPGRTQAEVVQLLRDAAREARGE